MAAKLGSRQRKLNHETPIAYKVKLGDVCAELIAQINALTVKYNAMAAKLDAAGSTVTGLGTNYVTTVGAPTTVIKDLETRTP